MMNFRNPIYQMDYQNCVISVFCWGDERLFFAQMNDAQGQPIGAAPRLYETVDAAVNVCKDLIDFLFGEVESYMERPAPTPVVEYRTAARQTARLVWP
jgi:hypothetical protein